MYDNLRIFFEKIKSLSFWQRVFGWKQIRTLSYDAYDEFTNMSESINNLDQEINRRETRIKELEKNAEISSARLSDLNSSAQKLENKLFALEGELSRLNKEKTELSNKIARFEQADQTRSEEFQKNVSAVNAIRTSLENDRKKLNDDRIREKDEQFEKMKQTWRNHENSVETTIRNICQTRLIEYVKEVPFKGNPDNTVRIAGEYIIFDAKSPAGDDLENFPRYLKVQTESVKKYAKQENVKGDIFLVIPSNTLDVIDQFIYRMGDYNVYIISIDSLEPIILSLKKIEDYEFAEQLTPDERENICRIIGKFAHTAKRKIQIDYFFSYQFLEILSKCNIDLPPDIYKSVQEFEKAEKLNPPLEKRTKQILTDDLIADSEKLALEARDKLLGAEEKD
jgi:archaellum component FlaC